MKLGNGLGASGAYFLKVFLVGGLRGVKLQSENAMGSEQVGAL